MKLLVSGLLLGQVLADTRFYLEDPNYSYWNDTNDSVLNEFKSLMSIAETQGKMGGAYGTQLRTLNRFAEMVDMIMFLQSVPFFGQFWYYGCWCAPEGFLHNIASGYGKPVDEIDMTCKHLSMCYACAAMDHGDDCNAKEVNYRWHGSRVHESDGKITKRVYCDDPVGSCGYSLCMCDKNMAQDFAWHESEWDIHHHQKWGDFDRDTQCVAEHSLFFGEANRVAGTGNRGSGSDRLGRPAEQINMIQGRKFMNDQGFMDYGDYDMDGPSLGLKEMHGAFGGSKQCCGPEGRRHTYDPSQQSCCTDQDNNEMELYNPLHRECCEDGSTAHTGECM